MLNLFKFGNDAHPMQQMLCIHFFKRLGPQKNIFWSYGRGRQGKAFYSLQPFSCPFLVRPLVEACHFIASYNFPMSFQNLSTYPLSDPNSLLENPRQDPPPKRNQDVRTWCVLHISTSKCASRHNGVHFFDISTSKSGPNMVCFAHFDFEMCFAPQRRALFRHLNFQKSSEPLSF